MTYNNIKPLLLLIWLFLIILEIAIGFQQWAGYYPMQHRLFIMTGTFGNPGPYACFISIGVPFALYYIIESKKFNFITGICIFTFLLSIIILPFLHSRTSFLSVIVGMIISNYKYILSKLRSHSLKLRIIYISTCIISLSILCFFLYTSKLESSVSRLFVYKLIIPHLYWTGIGLENIPVFLSNLQEEYFSTHAITSELFFSIDVPNKVMNEFLHMSLAYGILFGAILLFWFISCIILSFRMKEYGLTGSIFSLMIVFLFSYPLDYLEFIFVILIISILCSLYFHRIYYRLSFIFITFVIFLPITIGDVNNLSDQNKWEKLRILEGDYSTQSINVFEKCYLDGFKKPEFLFEYALKLRHNKMLDESQKVLKIGTSVSGDPAFLNEMAKNYIDIGKFHEAEACLIRSINKLPNRHYPHYLLALLYASPEYNNPTLFAKHYNWVMETPPKIPNKSIENMRKHLKVLLNY